MATGFKIRLLLFLLTLSFVITALTLRLTYHREDVLKTDAQELEKNLHEQEQFVNEFLHNRADFESLKTLDTNAVLAEKFLTEFRIARAVYVFTYNSNVLVFWGANRIAPQTDAGLKEGSNMVNWQNGWYEAIKRTDGKFSAVCYIPIKANYPIQNQYLQNVFAKTLIQTDNLDIAGLGDEQVYNIRSSIDSRYLFALKLKPVTNNTYFSRAEAFAWLATVLLSCILVNLLCSWLADRGYIKAGIAGLCGWFLLTRLWGLHSDWFISHFNQPVFDPQFYGAGFFYPSMGDFLLNGIAATWCLCFAYKYRARIRLAPGQAGTPLSIAVFIGMGAILSLTAIHLNNSLHGLVLNSSIRFDITSLIIDLNPFSWLGILVLCIAFLNLYLLMEILLIIGRSLPLSDKQRFAAFAAMVLFTAIVKLVQQNFDIFFLLFALVVYLRGWAIYRKNNEFNLVILVATVLLFATIASIKLSRYQFIKDREARRVWAHRLDLSDDQNAVTYFNQFESNLVQDEDLTGYFDHTKPERSLMKNKLQKFYFDGYLTRYDLSTSEYDPAGNSMDGDTSNTIDQFRELVVTGTIKVSQYFYRVNNTFGMRHYFAILPMSAKNRDLGTLVVELKSKTFDEPDAFPQVLAEGRADETGIIRDYSFAFYRDNRLVDKYGKFVYNLGNNEFTEVKNEFENRRVRGYDHLVYRPNNRNLIVVSVPVQGWLIELGSVSFLFLVLLTFSLVCVLVNWSWKNFVRTHQESTLAAWKYFISGGHILYKTRIQASIVAAVVTTLVLVGVITYYSISKQYSKQQEQQITERIARITTAFENQMLKNDQLNITFQSFNNFADVNSADLSFYGADGTLIYSTQPKIYDSFLIARKLNVITFNYLSRYHRSEYFNPEDNVGRMLFISGSRPVRNSRHEIIGYLTLPYFSNKHELEEHKGQFLNTLINVFSLILVSIGFFAVFMANRITYPLTIIQKSLRLTKIGRKNEAIKWHRNDEIGSLIREYNTMIEALEESAGRLARSERETAWKEMAKQVAHEIKNPLTPLKLGVQLLDKSWKENDPNFNKKFERFSKSFIEQIESLAHIANEFSNFAKMPETSLESVRLREVVERSIEVFSKLEHTSVVLDDQLGYDKMVKGDKDQLLRCFNNLIKNAIEAIPENRKGLIRISIAQRNDKVFVEISDNGKGIPDGLRERIFNPNFTTKSSGTGLGLAFVKQAIENMLGSIHFKTEHDVGTTFYITLPLA
ncbi:sensor histidine kinase [Hufsiella ginkgonis]|uniref:histidine kinase n=1 Tax=Hufsiella ginkgonis TaxID=2695274 RepID=A0A7K1XVD0_9SPHI|nr:GHKL domain-containing protein [Hufsiella ginkgonis]